jgi:hypothetical protein
MGKFSQIFKKIVDPGRAFEKDTYSSPSSFFKTTSQSMIPNKETYNNLMTDIRMPDQAKEAIKKMGYAGMGVPEANKFEDKARSTASGMDDRAKAMNAEYGSPLAKGLNETFGEKTGATLAAILDPGSVTVKSMASDKSNDQKLLDILDPGGSAQRQVEIAQGIEPGSLLPTNPVRQMFEDKQAAKAENEASEAMPAAAPGALTPAEPITMEGSPVTPSLLSDIADREALKTIGDWKARQRRNKTIYGGITGTVANVGRARLYAVK